MNYLNITKMRHQSWLQITTAVVKIYGHIIAYVISLYQIESNTMHFFKLSVCYYKVFVKLNLLLICEKKLRIYLEKNSQKTFTFFHLI